MSEIRRLLNSVVANIRYFFLILNASCLYVSIVRFLISLVSCSVSACFLRCVLIVVYGNSLRAIVKHLDGMSDTDIMGLNIPTGVPLVYTLDDALRPIDSGYLGDPEAAKARAEAVARQAQA